MQTLTIFPDTWLHYEGFAVEGGAGGPFFLHVSLSEDGRSVRAFAIYENDEQEDRELILDERDGLDPRITDWYRDIPRVAEDADERVAEARAAS
ncbi:hypothetical protein [Rhizobium phaseoli]|uniref:DUF1488 family protein n=1 Tax=Rhizobium phaseoli TaxID=396 RepID=A0ABN4QRK6_9HYPH|nr:hypothetical protein [Rhizobium phaseoli]ANL87122.1 hypothetical protein AMC81_PA00101 [Rhizobium phaseoli]ANL93631.1 hypothetical protein AMC80_PA00101 [Rhizobium phaseoli]